MTDATTDLAIIDDTVTTEASQAVALIDSLNNPVGAVYSSIKGDDFESKLAVAAALTSAEPVSDHLGEVIQLRNFVVQGIELTDPETGQMVEAASVTLVDEDGTAYRAVSQGLGSSLRTLIGVAGEPSSWPHAIPVYVAQETTRKGYRVFTLKFASAEAVTKAAKFASAEAVTKAAK